MNYFNSIKGIQNRKPTLNNFKNWKKTLNVNN